MIKRFALAVAVACLTGCAAAAENPKPFVASDLVHVEFDKFKGHTVVWAGPITLGAGNLFDQAPEMTIMVTAEKDSGVKLMGLRFTKTTGGGRWVFLRDRDIDFLIDGKPFSVGSGRHTGSVDAQWRNETLTADFQRPLLVALAAARSVEVRVGPVEAGLSKDDLSIIRSFTAKVDAVAKQVAPSNP
jgi:hypothetical protein